MSRLLTIGRNWEFQKVIEQNTKITLNALTSFILPSNTFRIGISIPKRFAKATVRNYNKRQIKNIIWQNGLKLTNFNVVLVIKRSFLVLSFKEKERVIIRVFKIWYDKIKKQKLSNSQSKA